MPLIYSAELAGLLCEPHATVHRALTGLLVEEIVGGGLSHDTRPSDADPENATLQPAGTGEAIQSTAPSWLLDPCGSLGLGHLPTGASETETPY